MPPSCSPFAILLVNIVILHCHFERGGVTQVVENHIRALRDSDQVEQIVLVGGGRFGGLSAETIAAVTTLAVDDFDYDKRTPDADSLPGRAATITARLQRALSNLGLTNDNSVLHWHNHSLGKNTASPEIIRLLARAGWRLLLQIHDFAEDNRPINYQDLITASGATDKAEIDRFLYPVASQIHYATLTRADELAIREIGTPADRTHWLPNSVVAPNVGPRIEADPHFEADPHLREDALGRIIDAMGLPSDARWCLYPVRGIRRKNVGEFLLLSRWTAPDIYSGLTLRPTTPVELRSYDRWRQLAKEVAPRAVFDAAHHDSVSYFDNLIASEFVISTSVAEGFGMTFLEPWLSRREVIARRLPTVADDFAASGVILNKLYDEIPIAGDADWIQICRQEYDASLADAWKEVPAEFRPQVTGLAGDPKQIDFAKLTPRRQIEVLRRMSVDRGFEADVQHQSGPLVQQLKNVTSSKVDNRIVETNVAVIRNEYSIEKSGASLLAIYQRLANASIDNEIRPPQCAGVGVDTINRARPFFPCRTEVL